MATTQVSARGKHAAPGPAKEPEDPRPEWVRSVNRVSKILVTGGAVLASEPPEDEPAH